MKPQDIQTKRLGLSNESLVYDKSRWRETELNRAHFGTAYITSAASEYAYAQLWNPVDSGVVLIAKDIEIYATSTYVAYGWMDTSLNNLCPSLPKFSSLINTALGEMRYEGNVSYGLIDNASCYAHYSLVNGLSDCYLINPGHGLTFRTSTTTKLISFIANWTEYPEELINLG